MEPLVRYTVLSFLNTSELGFTACVNKTWKKDAERCRRWFDLATAEIHSYLTEDRCFEIDIDTIQRRYTERMFDWKHVYRTISAFRMYAHRRFLVYDRVGMKYEGVVCLWRSEYVGMPTEVFMDATSCGPRLIVTPLRVPGCPSDRRFVLASVRTTRTKTYEGFNISESIVEFLTGIVPDRSTWLLDGYFFTCDTCPSVLNPIAPLRERKCPTCRQLVARL